MSQPLCYVIKNVDLACHISLFAQLDESESIFDKSWFYKDGI